MIDGQKMVFGVVDPLPLRGFPEGRARIRLRNKTFATVNIRPPQGGIRRFNIEEREGAWRPAFEIGANLNKLKGAP